MVAVVVSFKLLLPAESGLSNEQMLANEVVEQYNPEDVSQALQDLNLAIDYLNQVSQRTEAMIGGRFLVTPLQDSINASFQKAGIRERSIAD